MDSGTSELQSRQSSRVVPLPRRWTVSLIREDNGWYRAEARAFKTVDEDTILASAIYPKAANALSELGTQIDQTEAPLRRAEA